MRGAQPELSERCGSDVKPSVQGQPLAPADPARSGRGGDQQCDGVSNLPLTQLISWLCTVRGPHPSSDSQKPSENLPEALSQTLPLGAALNLSALQMHSGSQPSSSEMLRSITHQEAAILPPLPTLPLVSVSPHSCLFGPPSAAGEE